MAKKLFFQMLTAAAIIIVIVTHSHLPASSAAAKNTVIYTSGPDLTILYWAAGIIGGCIALTLSYVSWRKYKGEKEREERENKDKSVD
ncbi:sporulation protein YpjB [Virgibacillus sediminis]|uniref:Sporulation protein YpjB n=1 Tax=Virgibacillus sediminis TaxID=202260 RepID=A0ABV7A5I0_9BACI